MTALQEKATLFKKIREFFDAQGLIEVQTPSLLNTPTTDIYIDSIAVATNQGIGQKTHKYLHTSPELEMKKLLSKGSGDIYQICQVFRDNEIGERNFNEFTLLEYYRLDFDIHQLMGDISALLRHLGIHDEVVKMSYAQAFNQFGKIDILNTDFESLKCIALTHNLNIDFEWIEDLQMLLFVHLVEPCLKDFPVCFIYDYPSEQSALARVDGKIAHRFELYLSGVEVGNGYDELQSAKSYQQVFTRENAKRQQINKPFFELDLEFLASLEKPLPACSGVAIGIERLASQLFAT
ncbi:EF-P lysine aminoacylase EpmA [Candidatus Thioglobus sp.]|nr:EF-P lysine aminoacylase EpmA [Candidatus Thioglobus sp.]MDB3893718.1 EF-P lysine aminoacylase EpmA [Candidatus Thioglobus sp.]MDC0388574.1 EF-P lysine aminoacylase EpmA [Candidatus Thioglobus sp.]MDC0920653.1 EF-P lysine aminoacylase EpmA [Candidatus Thioglobus sp.]MDC0965762.1 EF-P lysine aminoacylase EpmA [Candidatus Thioglobus sp.]